jgi:uncharacterized RDD family membrane protein YckC
MECPNCKLENPPNAICDCGYNFETKKMGNLIHRNEAAMYGNIINLAKGGEFIFASLGSRIASQSLDALAGIIIGLAVFLILNFLNIGQEGASGLTFFAIICIYVLFSDGFKGGQSFGKRIMKIAVIDFKQGTPCTYVQSFIRNILQVLGIFDYIFIFGKKRQRLGDKAAGTFVVRSRMNHLHHDLP